MYDEGDVGQVTVGPLDGSDAVQLATSTAPVSLAMLQVTMLPVLLLAVQVPELTNPVSVLWQVICVPDELNPPTGVVAVQLSAKMRPVSVVLQVTVGPVEGSEGVQLVAARFTMPVSLTDWQVTVGPPEGLEATQVPEFTKPVSLVTVQVVISPATVDVVHDALLVGPVVTCVQVTVWPAFAGAGQVVEGAFATAEVLVWQLFLRPVVLS